MRALSVRMILTTLYSLLLACSQQMKYKSSASNLDDIGVAVDNWEFVQLSVTGRECTGVSQYQDLVAVFNTRSLPPYAYKRLPVVKLRDMRLDIATLSSL